MGSLGTLVVFERLLWVLGVLAQGLGEEPGTGQSQTGAAARQVGRAVCGITDDAIEEIVDTIFLPLLDRRRASGSR